MTLFGPAVVFDIRRDGHECMPLSIDAETPKETRTNSPMQATNDADSTCLELLSQGLELPDNEYGNAGYYYLEYQNELGNPQNRMRLGSMNREGKVIVTYSRLDHQDSDEYASWEIHVVRWDNVLEKWAELGTARTDAQGPWDEIQDSPSDDGNVLAIGTSSERFIIQLDLSTMCWQEHFFDREELTMALLCRGMAQQWLGYLMTTSLCFIGILPFGCQKGITETKSGPLGTWIDPCPRGLPIRSILW